MSFLMRLTRKPDRVRLEAYSKHCMQIAKFFQYTWENRQLPARDGYEPFPLDDQFARSTLEGTVFEIISEQKLAVPENRELKLAALIDHYKGQAPHDDAVALLNHVTYLDHAAMMYRDFYDRSREFESFLTITMQHCAVAWPVMFGQRIPTWLIEAWPNFAERLILARQDLHKAV